MVQPIGDGNCPGDVNRGVGVHGWTAAAVLIGAVAIGMLSRPRRVSMATGKPWSTWRRTGSARPR